MRRASSRLHRNRLPVDGQVADALQSASCQSAGDCRSQALPEMSSSHEANIVSTWPVLSVKAQV